MTCLSCGTPDRAYFGTPSKWFPVDRWACGCAQCSGCVKPECPICHRVTGWAVAVWKGARLDGGPADADGGAGERVALSAPRERMRHGKAGHPGPTRLGFGKYRGMVLTEIPTTYLAWLASTPDLLPGLRQAVLAELERRRMESGAVSEARNLLAEARGLR